MKTGKRDRCEGRRALRVRALSVGSQVCRGLLAAGLISTTSGLRAQTVVPPQVDPAALQRQEMQRVNREKHVPEPAEAASAVISGEPGALKTVPMASGVKFVLKDVKFGSSAFLKEEELATLALPFVGKEVDFSDLQKLVAEVNALYRQHGVSTASASLPRQKIQGGVVAIELLEARVGQVEVHGSRYIRPAFVSNWFTSELGEPLDGERLEDRIKRFNRNSDVQMVANLRPGAGFGLTDVLLELHEPARYQMRVFANNEGAQSVGRSQAGVDMAMNGPAGIGDKLSLYVSSSRGATSGALTYSAPVNTWGGRLNASFNQGVTDVVAGTYSAVGITGISKSAQLAAVQPVLQMNNWWLDLAAAIGKTQSRNEIGGLDLSTTDIQNETFGGTLSGATDQRSLSLNVTATHASARAGGAATRQFNVGQVTGSWVENFGASTFGLLRGSAQKTNDLILSPSLLFQVGGIASVRGYEVGVLSGDSGHLVNLELHRHLSNEVDGHFFFDWGGVSTKGLPSQNVHSVGAGLDLQPNQALSGNVTIGHPLVRAQPDQRKWILTARASYIF